MQLQPPMNTFPPDAGEPAMPAQTDDKWFLGFTKRERAAIDLKVPDSGCEWLDAMIRESAHRDCMLKMVEAVMNRKHVLVRPSDGTKIDNLQSLAEFCSVAADALLQQSEVKSDSQK